MHFKDEKGAALMLVLLLMIIGTILVGALFTTVRSHLSTAVHQEAMSKAFNSAESGVEFIRGNIDKIDFSSLNEDEYLSVSIDEDDIDMKFDNTEEWIDSDTLDNDFFEDIQFNIQVEENSGDITFISTGKYDSSGREYKEKIKFDIAGGSNFKSFNIQFKGEDVDHYNEAGPGNLVDHIYIHDWGTEDFNSFLSLFLSDSFFDNIDDNYRYEDENVSFNNENINGENLYIKNGDLTIKKTEINNSIVVIDGDLDFNPPKNEINNSVILVKGNVSSQGASANSDLNNNMVFIYANETNNQGYYLDFRGTGSFNVNPQDLPEEYQPKLSINNWKQL
jgi:hypothetical protein